MRYRLFQAGRHTVLAGVGADGEGSQDGNEEEVEAELHCDERLEYWKIGCLGGIESRELLMMDSNLPGYLGPFIPELDA